MKGGADAFNPIVEAFQDMAVSYATSILRDVHLAEDAAQNSFVTGSMKDNDHLMLLISFTRNWTSNGRPGNFLVSPGLYPRPT